MLRILLACLVGVLVLGYLLLQMDEAAHAMRSELLDSHLYYSYEYANGLVNTLHGERAQAYATLAWWDLGFILVYTPFFLAMLSPITRLRMTFAMAPLCLAALDVMESCTVPMVMNQYLPRSALWIPVVCTPLKWSAVLVCVFAVLAKLCRQEQWICEAKDETVRRDSEDWTPRNYPSSKKTE